MRLEESRPHALQDEVAFTLAQGLKSSWRSADVSDPKGREDFRRYAVALHYLRERVGDRYRPYFEDPRPDEPIYALHEREQFWRDWRGRHDQLEQVGALTLGTNGR